MRRVAVALLGTAAMALPLTAQADELTDEPRNQAPVAAPDRATVTAGESVTVKVLANDSDDGLPGPLTVVAVDDARATFGPDSVTFEAPPEASDVTFGYTISDGELEASSTVTVTVTQPPPPPEPQPGVSLRAPRIVVGLQRFTVTGHVTPERRMRVVLHRRLGSGPWREVARTTSTREGRFSFTQRTNRLVRLRFRASIEGARSTVVGRRVVARPQLVVSGPLSAADVPWSYRAGCPVGPASLRRITVTHLGYEGVLRRGRIVVAASAVPAVKRMLTKALAAGFPFRRLTPTDRFYLDGRRTPTQSDVAAMRADNTSAFNCRSVTGNPYRLSQHSYGNAIDINTVRNPYVTGSRVYPSFAGTYLNRGWHRPGMIFRDGAVASSFRGSGWLWGARWAHPDYQHFSSNGG